MGLFRRKGGGGGEGDDEAQGLMTQDEPLPEMDAATTEAVQEVMTSHLDMMKEIVLKIRYEKGYAKNMYVNCPRLQHLLEQNPDIRPVFEDARLVRINFETVYKEAGGVLPEDEEKEGQEKEKKTDSWIMKIAKSPFFKLLKYLLMLKKVIGCIAGGGIGAIGGCVAVATDCCTQCCCEDAFEEILDDDNFSEGGDADQPESATDTLDLDGDVPDVPMDANAQVLNQAADYMEDPDVQENMQRLMEDPDNLAEAIENDTELRGLRDSNPLCAELMQDPETMKILVDPDNLRALGEAPQMIELDFADPDPGSFTPDTDFIDIDTGGGGDVMADMDLETDFDVDGGDDFGDVDGDGGDDFDVDGDGDADGDFEGEDDEGWEDDEGEGEEGDGDGEDGEEEEDGGWEEDIELEQQEMDAPDADANAEAAQKGKGKQQNKKSAAQEAAAKKGGMAGIMASMGVAAVDVIASQIVGQIFGDALPIGDIMAMGGGGDDIDLGALDDVADQADDLGDAADIAEDATDEIADGKDEIKEDQAGRMMKSPSGRILEAGDALYDADGRKRSPGLLVAGGSAAAAGAAGGMFYAGKDKSRGRGITIPEGDEKEEENDSGSDDDDGFESVNSNEDQYDDEFEDEEVGGTKKKKKKGKDDDDDEEEEEDDKKKKKRFGLGALKDIAAATVTGAKETIAATFLGDDFAEMLVERMEEGGDESGSEESKGSKESKSDDDKKKKGKKKKKSTGNENNNSSDDEFADEDKKPQSSKKGGFFSRKEDFFKKR